MLDLLQDNLINSRAIKTKHINLRLYTFDYIELIHLPKSENIRVCFCSCIHMHIHIQYTMHTYSI